jgi:hypothetical protein
LGTSPAAAATPEATIFVANFGADNPTSYALAGGGSALPDVHVLGQGFSGPDAMAVAGDDVFVANQGGNSVTESTPRQARQSGSYQARLARSFTH